MVYEVNGQVGVRMGRRRKYLIDAYTKSLHLNTDCFTCPIVFFHFFLYFLLTSVTVYFFSLSHAYSKKYLSVACIYKETLLVFVCLCAACPSATLHKHCLNVLQMGFIGPCLSFFLHVHLVPLFISAVIWTKNYCVMSMFLPLTTKAVVAVL